jgi:hypothetical protein
MPEDNTPTFEPREITIGETLNWTKALDDFPASEWALTYYFRGAGPGFDATAVANGDTHTVTIAATTTASLVAGVYYWQAWASKGPEKHVTASGQTTVKQGLAGVEASTTVDERSKVKKILDAIDDLIAGRAVKDVHMYMIGNRQLMHIPATDLLSWRKYYAVLYAKERQRAKAKKGRPFFSSINVRFDNPK